MMACVEMYGRVACMHACIRVLERADMWVRGLRCELAWRLPLLE